MYDISNSFQTQLREGEKSFIATQAPTEVTVENFYQMVEENCSTLTIMLCPCKEDDKQMSAEYFPTR
jgi:protein tyrosine phosphatase